MELNRIPPPAYRHAAPSAPWPWIDIRDGQCSIPSFEAPRSDLLSLGVDQKQLNTKAPPVPKDCDHTTCNGLCWKGYPQSRFPNWTPSQVKKCKIYDAITKYDRTRPCIIYKLDIDKNGIFHDSGRLEMFHSDDEAVLDKEWDRFRGDHVRIF